jgi:hypothetical protein
MHDVEHQLEDSEDAILLPSKGFIPRPPSADSDSPSKWFTLAMLGLSVLAVACGCTSYIVASASMSGQRDARGLRQANQHPGLELLDEIMGKGAYVRLSWTLCRKRT